VDVGGYFAPSVTGVACADCDSFIGDKVEFYAEEPEKRYLPNSSSL